MSYLVSFIYDKFMNLPEKACLRAWREELLKQVYGNVLEIGAGTGANLPFYPELVTSLVLSEPDKHMRRQLVIKAGKSTLKDVSVSSASVETLNADEASYDFVVASLVCCSVKSPEAALDQIHRVLKPGGRFVFIEHVAADENSKIRRWQDRINPLWRKMADNCHLNRETEKAIESAGFQISEIKRESMSKMIPLVSPVIRGIAVKS